MNAIQSSVITTHLYNELNKPVHNRNKKNDEIRKHYNMIAEINQRSPVYIVRMDSDNQEYLLNLKDCCIKLSNEIMCVEEQKETLLSRRRALTSDKRIEPKIVSDHYEDLPDEFDIEVLGLARQQINRSTQYYDSGKGLPSGVYQLGININDSQYHIDFPIREGERNRSVMERLTQTINTSKLGINASVCTASDKKIYLSMESVGTGSFDEPIFTFEDIDRGRHNNGMVAYYGLNKVVQEPCSSSFLINGEQKHSLSNEIVLNRSLGLCFNNISENTVHIGYEKEGKEIFDQIDQCLGLYNSLVGLAKYSDTYDGERSRLYSELEMLIMKHSAELEEVGIEKSDTNRLSLNRTSANVALQEDMTRQLFDEGGFLTALKGKCSDIAINPVEYTKRIIVSYPDYSKEGPRQTYLTSSYCGMFFNYYC